MDVEYFPTTTAKGGIKKPSSTLSHEIHNIVNEVADEGAGGQLSDKYYSILQRKRREVDYYLQAILLRLDRQNQTQDEIERINVLADERLKTIKLFLSKFNQ